MTLSSKQQLTGKESPFATKEGWLTKQGNYIKNWRPRWCQLKEGILYYYKDPSTENVPTNYFLLAGSKVSTSERHGENCFELTMANGETRYMRAESIEDRDEWIRALNNWKAGRNALKDNSGAGAAGMDGATGNGGLSPDSFHFLKVLGKGNYGKVMLATMKSDDPTAPKYYAVKIIKKSSLIDNESLEHVLSENRVLQTLNHPNIVKLYHSFQTSDRLYFVMEFVRGGELFFHLRREKRFSEEKARFYAAQIVMALSYLHSVGVVYRDLKLENLLLDEKGNIKLTDFGLCKEGICSEADRTSTFCGTPEYLAPEVLEEENYGKSVDWWALGIVLYEMMVGRAPFGPASTMQQLFKSIISKEVVIPASLSPSAQSILSKLLVKDYTQRLGCGSEDGKAIMEHPFFVGIDFNQLAEGSLTPPSIPWTADDADVRNFDKEFTALPAILTPNHINNSHLNTASGNPNNNPQREAIIKLENFSYSANDSIL